MDYDEVALKYEKHFGEEPPVLVTLSRNDEQYLKTLLEAIERDTPLTRNELAEKFMTNDKVVY